MIEEDENEDGNEDESEDEAVPVLTRLRVLMSP